MITFVRIARALTPIAFVAMFLGAQVAMAGLPPQRAPVLYKEGADDVLAVIKDITGWIFVFVMALSTIFLLVGAFQYVTSGGGEQTEKATQTIKYAIIGIIVALVAGSVSLVIRSMIEY